MKIRIATETDKSSLDLAAFTQAKLTSLGIESELLMVNGTRAQQVESAILRGEADVSVHWLCDVAVRGRDGLAITALFQRFDRSDCLLIRPEWVEKQQIFALKAEARLAVFSDLQKMQIMDYRPDLRVNLYENIENGFFDLKNGDLDGLILASAWLEYQQVDLTAFERRQLNPQEFIPFPGQGIMALQCNRQDNEVRSIVSMLHQPDVSALSNVERRVLQCSEGGTIGAFCERDARGNYHAFAVSSHNGVLKRARLSSATNVGLADALFRQLSGG